MLEEEGMRGFRMYLKITEAVEFLIGTLATMAIATIVEASVLGEPMTWKRAFKHSLSSWGAAISTGMLAGCDHSRDAASVYCPRV